MITASQIEQEFRQRLLALLKEYNAELTAEDHWTGYAECGQDVKMTVYISGQYDEDGDCIREYTEINLGSYIDGNSV